MKRLIFSSLCLLGAMLSQQAMGQGGYTDDIYFNSSDLEKQKSADQRSRQQQNVREDYNDPATEYDSRYSTGYGNEYADEGYIDYEYDDYSYARNMRRFNQPFYNMGYYSPFYDPFWYNPYWYDPYWGWSPWARPGFSISFGVGPYWNSYWGWHTWYGYGQFNSFYYYPSYGGMYGNPYYSGYWNGYYAGLYQGGGGYRGRQITYGPRNATNYAYNTEIRRSPVSANRNLSGERSGARPGVQQGIRNNNNATLREAPNRTVRPGTSEMPAAGERRNNPATREITTPSRNRFSRDEQYNNPVERTPRERQIRSAEPSAPVRSREYRQREYAAPAPNNNPRRENNAPSRNIQTPAPRPQISAPAPRMSAPSPSVNPGRMSAPPTRSGGGLNGGGRTR